MIPIVRVRIDIFYFETIIHTIDLQDKVLKILTSRLKKPLFLFLFLFLVGNCSNKRIDSPMVMQINSVKITEQDIAFKQSVDSCYSYAPDSVGPKEDRIKALVQLAEAGFYEAVARKYDVVVTDEMLNCKRRLVDKNTKAPGILYCIKSIFKGNQEEYDKIVLKPILLNQLLHAKVSRDTLIQEERRAKISKLFSQIKDTPHSFQQIAKGENCFRRVNYRKGNEVSPLITRYKDLAKAEPKMEKILQKLKPGVIYPQIVESDHSYQVIQLVEENDTTYVYNAALVEKVAFGPWFKQEVAGLEIKIREKELTQLRQIYPSLWWVKLKLDLLRK